jgi:hypothetical protein
MNRMRIDSRTRTWRVALFAVGLLTAAATAEMTIEVASETGSPESEVAVPIQVSGVKGAASVDIRLTFDPKVLKAGKVEPGKVAGDAMVQSNTETEGALGISLVSSSGLDADEGELVVAHFTVVGEKGDKCEIAPDYVEANKSDLSQILVAERKAGEFEVTGGIPIWIFIVIGAVVVVILLVVILAAALKKKPQGPQMPPTG